MKLPWISRSSHEAMTALLATQVADLREEREILLDRLATLGLGGPLFSRDPETVQAEPEVKELFDPAQEERELRARLKNRPSKLVLELAALERRRVLAEAQGARAQRVSYVNSLLDGAESELKAN
jgi:hypothetical protein